MARLSPLAVIVSALLLTIAAVDASGADFVVDSTVDAVDVLPGDGICAAVGGGCTVRAAITEANQFPGTDAISIPAGMYETGGLAVGGGVSIRGAGAGLTILHGTEPGAVLALSAYFESLPQAPAVIEISDLSITGGSADGLNVDGYAYPVDVTISDCVIEHSSPRGIGAYMTYGSFLKVLRTRVAQNNGPGIIVSGSFGMGGGSVHLLDTVVAENSAPGVAVYGPTLLLIEDSLIRGTTGGPGVFVGEAVHLDIRRTTIEENAGGVIADCFFYGGVSIADSAIVRNSAGSFVGGVYLSWCQPAEILNSTISGNSGATIGGLAAEPIGPISVLNSTIVDNVGDQVGGIAVGEFSAVTLSGSLVAGNTSSSGPSDCRQFAGDREILSSGGNLVGDGSGCMFGAQPSDLVGTAWSPIDPLIAPLAMNGGPTLTHALLPGSPAIDAGGTACLATDQRGVARPLDGNGNGLWACDIGAYEACPFVGTDADNDGIPDACEDLVDSDGDRVGDSLDNCPATANTDQHDGDVDGVGNECDNCVAVSNPRMPAGWLASNGWAVTTGGQRDDDFDGYGNKCDAKFPGSLGAAVGTGDLNQFRASNGKYRTESNCGSTLGLPCAIFDLDENTSAANAIGALDLARFRALSGWAPGPRCTTCPLECEAGALRSCEP